MESSASSMQALSPASGMDFSNPLVPAVVGLNYFNFSHTLQLSTFKTEWTPERRKVIDTTTNKFITLLKN